MKTRKKVIKKNEYIDLSEWTTVKNKKSGNFGSGNISLIAKTSINKKSIKIFFGLGNDIYNFLYSGKEKFERMQVMIYDKNPKRMILIPSKNNGFKLFSTKHSKIKRFNITLDITKYGDIVNDRIEITPKLHSQNNSIINSAEIDISNFFNNYL